MLSTSRPAWKVLIWILIFLFGLFRGVELIGEYIDHNNTLASEAQVNSQQRDNLLAENALLKDKLAHASEVDVDDRTRQIVEFYLTKYFGKDAPRAEKIFTCESHLNPNTVHVNAPGLGSDHGISQLNDRFQSVRFEQVMGIPFSIGSHDIQDNIKYAKFLHDIDKGFSPWVCDKLV